MTSPGKVCCICGVWHGQAEFSYGGRDGRSYCRACDREDRRLRRERGREAVAGWREAMRRRWAAGTRRTTP